MNTICPFRLLMYQIISSRLELMALTITWYTVPCLLIRASSDLFNVLFYFLPQPALSEVSNSLRQPEFTLRAVSFLTGKAFTSSSPFCFSLLYLFLLANFPQSNEPCQTEYVIPQRMQQDLPCLQTLQPALRREVIYSCHTWHNGTLNRLLFSRYHSVNVSRLTRLPE